MPRRLLRFLAFAGAFTLYEDIFTLILILIFTLFDYFSFIDSRHYFH